MKAEQFIKDYTKRCSNELVDGGYHEWLTPDQALKAVEIAIEEVTERACKFVKDYDGWNYLEEVADFGYFVLNEKRVMDDLRKAIMQMNDESDSN